MKASLALLISFMAASTEATDPLGPVLALMDDLKIQLENEAVSATKAAIEYAKWCNGKDSDLGLDKAQKCAGVAADHEASMQARSESLAGIAEAKKILSEASAGALGQNYSYLQIAKGAEASSQIQSSPALARKEIVKLVKKLAKQHHSVALAQLAFRIASVFGHDGKASEDPFSRAQENKTIVHHEGEDFKGEVAKMAEEKKIKMATSLSNNTGIATSTVNCDFYVFRAELVNRRNADTPNSITATWFGPVTGTGQNIVLGSVTRSGISSSSGWDESWFLYNPSHDWVRLELEISGENAMLMDSATVQKGRPGGHGCFLTTQANYGGSNQKGWCMSRDDDDDFGSKYQNDQNAQGHSMARACSFKIEFLSTEQPYVLL